MITVNSSGTLFKNGREIDFYTTRKLRVRTDGLVTAKNITQGDTRQVTQLRLDDDGLRVRVSTRLYENGKSQSHVAIIYGNYHVIVHTHAGIDRARMEKFVTAACVALRDRHSFWTGENLEVGTTADLINPVDTATMEVHFWHNQRAMIEFWLKN